MEVLFKLMNGSNRNLKKFNHFIDRFLYKIKKMQNSEENKRNGKFSNKWFNKPINKKRVIIILACILINLILFLIIYNYFDMYFATNDDYRMRLIVNGGYTGTPSINTVFIKTFISRILCALYSFKNNIPWYGVSMLFSMYITSTYFLWTLISLCRTKYAYTFTSILYIIFFIFIIQKHLREVQFTIVSAFWGFCAIISLLNIIDSWEIKNYANENSIISNVYFYRFHGFVFTLSCVFSYSYREKIFLMTIPLIVYIIAIKSIKNKKLISKLVPIFIIALIGLSVVYIDNAYHTNRKDYKEYNEFNELRSEIYDYNYIPKPYDEYKSFYDSLGLTQADYKVLISKTLDVSDKLNSQTYDKIIEYGKGIYKINIFDRIYKGITQSFEGLTNTIVKFEVMFFVLVLGIAWYIETKIKGFSSISKLLINGTIGYVICGVIVFIIFGRIMPRLTETLILISSTILIYLESKHLSVLNNRLPSISINSNNFYSLLLRVSSIILVLIIFISFIFSNQNRLANQEEVSANNASKLYALNNYAVNNPKNFYFYNAKDFIASSDQVLREQTHIVNTESLGNWLATSPIYYQRNKNYGFEHAIDGLLNRKNVYYACTGDTLNSVKILLESKYDKRLKEVDKFIYNKNKDKIYIYKIVSTKKTKKE